MNEDKVVLTVPARGEMARTVRMTAAALAGRMGMSIDAVEDVRIAIEEAYLFAVDRCGLDDSVTFMFRMAGDGLEVLVGPLEGGCLEDGEDEAGIKYARFILDAVCDEFTTDEREGRSYLKLVKKMA